MSLHPVLWCTGEENLSLHPVLSCTGEENLSLRPCAVVQRGGEPVPPSCAMLHRG